MAPRTRTRKLRGIGVSDGIAIGRAVVVAKREVGVFRIPIPEAEIDQERYALKALRGDFRAVSQGIGRSDEALAAVRT